MPAAETILKIIFMRILIGTGTSGGHVFPALALAEALKAKGQEVLLVLPRKEQGYSLGLPEGLALKTIPAVVLSLRLDRKNLLGLWLFLASGWESLKIVLKFKPDVAVGFGSLNTAALIFWAWLMRAKTLIHEQNVQLGQANRLLAQLVDKVAVSFGQTQEGLKIDPQRVALTGNPLRSGLLPVPRQSAGEFFGFKNEKTTILIVGGSQGSRRLNTVCQEFFPGYPAKDRLQLIHICGQADLASLREQYSSGGLVYKAFDFLAQMQYAYSIADLVICRAGATTIAELQRFKIPAILVPYPFAYAHQLANARVLEKQGAAVIIRDEDFNPQTLGASLQRCLDDPGKLAAMRQAYVLPKQDALTELVREVLSFKLSG